MVTRPFIVIAAACVLIAAGLGSVLSGSMPQGWSPVDNAVAVEIVGGELPECTNWSIINCPTPKMNCSAVGCHAPNENGSILNRTYDDDSIVPCGTGDPEDDEFCPDNIAAPFSCGTT